MKKIYALPMIALALAACESAPRFTIDGTVADAAGKTLILERMDPDAGWLPVDSASIASDGSFSISAPAPDAPDLFRIALQGSYIYLPVDSTETLTLTAKGTDFSRGFSLTGTAQAADLAAFEREAVRVAAMQHPDSTETFRGRVFQKYLQNARGNMLSYYILTRRWGDEYLIDYTSPYYAAVATAFSTYRPDDPHTRALEERARQGISERHRQAGRTKVVEAEQTAMVEISLPDKEGKTTSLSSLLGKGKPVIVAFSALTLEDAPAINLDLKEIYASGKADIYQVCLDADQYAWKQAAKALPWTVVYDVDGVESRAALAYNVAIVPTFFIYNAAGELTARTSDLADLKRHF